MVFGDMPSSANPILSTVETIKGYPSTLKVFKCAESRFWQVSAYLDRRLVRKSTKLEEKALAVKFAKTFYNDLLLKQAQHIPLTQSATFEIVAADLFKEDQGRVDRGERKQSMVDDAKYLYEADIQSFFKRTHVKDISYQRLNDYVKHLKKSREDEGKPALKSKTIKNHFILLSKILKHAHKLGYIDRLPVFPTIVAQDNPREWFSDDQYEHLLKITDEEIGKQAKVRFLPITIQLRYLIEFTANSYLRPPDIKTLKNNQITRVKNYLRIAATSKVKASPVITQPVAAEIFEQLNKVNKDFQRPDDYVFYPEHRNREYAMQTMNRQFNHVLVLAGLKDGPQGAKRTLYSLRHTCIMNTLLKAKNMDLLTLARNCRTSVDMLE